MGGQHNHADFKFEITAEAETLDEPVFDFIDLDVIYTDDCIALTLFEYCYAIWTIKDGVFERLFSVDVKLSLDGYGAH